MSKIFPTEVAYFCSHFFRRHIKQSAHGSNLLLLTFSGAMSNISPTVATCSFLLTAHVFRHHVKHFAHGSSLLLLMFSGAMSNISPTVAQQHFHASSSTSAPWRVHRSVAFCFDCTVQLNSVRFSVATVVMIGGLIVSVLRSSRKRLARKGPLRPFDWWTVCYRLKHFARISTSKQGN